MIDDDVVNTIDAGPGTEPATSLLPAGDMELSSPSSSAATITDYKWTDLLVPVYVDKFTEAVGSAVTVPSSPLKVFQLFFTSVIMEYIVRETNRYASRCQSVQSVCTYKPSYITQYISE
uniref:PiggyBac transposable element-derived protein domain-containing protein n=1 Tax=Amphimedon queenslandica TaxID=400682 RepID=A0A1X7TE81_AMPQE